MLLYKRKYLFPVIFLIAICILPRVAWAQGKDSATVYRLFLLGNGALDPKNGSQLLNKLAERIPKKDTATVILLLGDRPVAGYHLNDSLYLKLLQQRLGHFTKKKSRIIAVPGKADWLNGHPAGIQYVQGQSAFFEKNSPAISFLPANGCPGPEVIALGDSLVLVLLDSQWWLHPFEKETAGNDCACKTEEEVLNKLHDLAFLHRNKTILIATHHPFKSNGKYGGYFQFKQHLFPLTDLNQHLYLPMPLIGSLYPFVRKNFGMSQDLSNPYYKNMVTSVRKAMSPAPNLVFLAAHEDNFQVLQEGENYFVTAGTAEKGSRVKKDGDALFVSEEPGFAEIDFGHQGSWKVKYHGLNPDTTRPQFSGAYTFKPQQINLPSTEESNRKFPDSITVAIAADYHKVGKLHRRLFGEGYRELWALPVKLKVFDLKKEKGGLTILQKGGGQQTKSLRLKDKNNKEWVLRTVQKEAERALPPELKGTIAKQIIQDQVSAAHPFAPLTIPPLAEALKIPHANPQMVFIPDDNALGIYQEDFANTVCIFEEREPGHGGRTYNTLKLIDKSTEDNDVIVDQKAVLRARLLDFVVGDWDRHEDQWRWEKQEVNEVTSYIPIPRDRDQAYFVNTGVIPFIAARKWLMPKFQGFAAKTKNINGFMFNARYFDRMFLHKLSRKDWKEVVANIQQNLTDTLLEASVGRLPDSIYQLSGKKLISNLHSRIKNLDRDAMVFYKFISKTVDIPGSDKAEIFDIETLENKTIKVAVFKQKKNGGIGKQLYNRTFAASDTKELRLYGLNGNDQFTVSGKYAVPMKIRMIGGGGADKFYVADSVGKKRKLVIYDQKEDNNHLDHTAGAVTRVEDNPEVNFYDRRNFRYNKLIPKATLNYNLDDGILLGAGFQSIIYKFRKEPYGSRINVLAGHAVATNASFARIDGHFPAALRKLDLRFDVNFRAPNNTSNFFGKGNNTQYLEKEEHPIRYYRSRFNLITGEVVVEKKLLKRLKVYGGFTTQLFEIDSSKNTNRYLSTYQQQNPGEQIFSSGISAGVVAGWTFESRNSPATPTRGIFWNTELIQLRNISGAGGRFFKLKTDFSFAASFSLFPKIVIVNSLGGGSIWGDPRFFQLLYLGGNQHLRGYRQYRFAGTEMFYHNLELRLKLFDFQSYLFPGSFGIIGFNDIGMVGIEKEKSGLLHHGYGGGIYITPVQLVEISAVIGVSKDGVLPYFTFGFKL